MEVISCATILGAVPDSAVRHRRWSRPVTRRHGHRIRPLLVRNVEDRRYLVDGCHWREPELLVEEVANQRGARTEHSSSVMCQGADEGTVGWASVPTPTGDGLPRESSMRRLTSFAQADLAAHQGGARGQEGERRQARPSADATASGREADPAATRAGGFGRGKWPEQPKLHAQSLERDPRSS